MSKRPKLFTQRKSSWIGVYRHDLKRQLYFNGRFALTDPWSPIPKTKDLRTIGPLDVRTCWLEQALLSPTLRRPEGL